MDLNIMQGSQVAEQRTEGKQFASYNVTFSEQGYSSKPQKYNEMIFHQHTYTLSEIYQQIRQGHTYMANMNGETEQGLNCGKGTHRDFRDTQIVHFDFDNTRYSPLEVFNALPMKPTFVYTSYRNRTEEGDNSYRFHLMYVFRDKICSEQSYRQLWEQIASTIHDCFPDYKVDVSSKSPKQLINGSNSQLSNYEEYISDSVYSISDFLPIGDGIEEQILQDTTNIGDTYYCTSTNHSEIDKQCAQSNQNPYMGYRLKSSLEENMIDMSLSKMFISPNGLPPWIQTKNSYGDLNDVIIPPPKEQESRTSKPNVIFDETLQDDEQWIKKVQNMSIQTVVTRYQDIYQHKEHSDITYNDSGYAIVEGTTFCEHQRRWKTTYKIDGTSKRVPCVVPIGKRHHELPRTALFIRTVWQDKIRLDELIYEMAYEVYNHYNISDGDISMKDIISVAKWAITRPLSLKQQEKKRYKVSKEYCMQNGMTPRQYSPKVRGIIRCQKLLAQYDISQTIKENYERMKPSGYVRSYNGLKQWKEKWFGKGKITQERYEQVMRELSLPIN